MRALAVQNIASFLPDLPSQNESALPLAQVDLPLWRAAFIEAAQAARATHIVSLRGGALFDAAPGLPVWRHAPSNGKKLATTMLRAQMAADKAQGIERRREDYLQSAGQTPIMLGGKLFSGALLHALMDAGEMEGAHIIEDKGPFGPPLWLRAEPGEDASMAHKMAAAIAAWARSTGA